MIRLALRRTRLAFVPFLAALAVAGTAAPLAHAQSSVRERMASPLGPTRALADSFVARETLNNLVDMTITNYGFIGNNFVNRSGSMEYPRGSGFEHLVRAGIWIGARTTDDPLDTLRVTTATVDGAQGSSAADGTEFTPASNRILVLSKLSNSQNFSPTAVSEEDLISRFNDTRPKNAQFTNERHRPIQVEVRQSNYSWSFSDYKNFVIFHYVIKNIGPPLRDVHFGIYAEFASGNKNGYSGWPPSSSSGGSNGSWYNKKVIAYDDTLRLMSEHYCFAPPVPGGCFFERVPYWVGVKMLTPPDTANGQKVTFAAWNYAPAPQEGSSVRDEDFERYAIMSSGNIQPIEGDSLMPGTGDPVELIALGPFAVLDPGDSITVDFAFVGGGEIPEFHRYARQAQNAYDRNYVVPVPPPSPLFRVVARDTALDLYWDDSPETATDPTSPILQDFEGYRVYIGQDRLQPALVAEVDLATPPHDTTGFNTTLDRVRLPAPVVIDGLTCRYKYSVGGLRNGFKYYAAVTSFDLGSTEIESLESGLLQNQTLAIPGPAPGENARGGKISVYPNPYRVEAVWDQGRLVRDHYLWFTNLPRRCTLKIFTLSGDLVFETNFDGDSYYGESARGVYDPRTQAEIRPPVLSGTSFAWNLITQQGQAAATGLYLYAVEDLETGERHVSKFLIVKSDREGF